MHTLTADDLERQPRRLIEDAQRGEASIVTQDGQPVMLAVPLGMGLDSAAVRLELAVTLFDREQVSLGTAARLAGLAVCDMIGELGRRKIAVIRSAPGELEGELAAFGE